MAYRFTLATLLLCIVFPVHAAVPAKEWLQSSDIPLTVDGVTILDDEIVVDVVGGGATKTTFPSVPARADIDAYARLPNGDVFLSFDSPVDLPSHGATILADPGDVVRFDGSDYTIELDASALGVGPANLDAITIIHETNGAQMAVSFDRTVTLGSLTVGRSDLALFVAGAFDTSTAFFVGGPAGIGADLDLDAAHYLLDSHLLFSFDAPGEVGGVAFDDDDTLEYAPFENTWTLVHDGSAEHPGWVAADLDALDVTCWPAGEPYLQMNKPASGIVQLLWQPSGNAVAYDIVSGDLDQLRADGGDFAQATDRCVAGITFTTQHAEAAPGGNLWYLVRALSPCGGGSYGGSIRDSGISSSPSACP